VVSQKRNVDIVIGLSAVVIAVTAGEPRVLTVDRPPNTLGSGTKSTRRAAEGLDALPSGPFDPVSHRTLELGLRGWVGEQTSLPLGYVEQLYTFADLDREGGTPDPAARMVSIGYLALTREAEPSGDSGAQWQNWYRYFPWEDGRRGRSTLVAQVIEPRLTAWAASARNLAERTRRDQRVRAGTRSAVLNAMSCSTRPGWSRRRGATADWSPFQSRPGSAKPWLWIIAGSSRQP
jgi:hypothetical protein